MTIQLTKNIEYSFVTGHLEIPNEQPDGPSNLRTYREAITGPEGKAGSKVLQERVGH